MTVDGQVVEIVLNKRYTIRVLGGAVSIIIIVCLAV